jgi:hypothetical protein
MESSEKGANERLGGGGANIMLCTIRKRNNFVLHLDAVVPD